MGRHGQIERPDGTRIGFRVDGDGPRTVVLLHGLAGHSGEWDDTVAALRDGYTTVAIDQRGHGTSTRRPADTGREAFADDVAAVVEAAGVPRPVTLVGQSMGAHTAFVAAARHPELVDRLVMAESDVGGGGADAARDLHEALSGWPPRFASYDEMRDFFGDSAHSRVWAYGYERVPDGWRTRFELSVMDAVIGPVFATERWDEWRALRVPTLLVLAERSDIDAGRVERMCRLRPETRRVVVPGTGHDLHLDQPEVWRHTLLDFLAEAAADR